jgi:DNA helicase-2/ATP-dependent DNA helicase PcrA
MVNDMYQTIYNEQQQEVIRVKQGKHLVLAPPGCGKTHILAQRTLEALKQGLQTTDMLCMTFTNRAARGMRGRIAELVGEGAEDLFVGNVHRYCSMLLFDENIIGASTSIIDDDDIMDIVHDICAHSVANYQDVHYVPNFHHFMKQLRLGVPNDLLLHVATLPCKLELKQLCGHMGLSYGRQSVLYLYDHLDEIPEMIAIHYERLFQLMQFAHQYENYKEEYGMVDFDDVLILAYHHLCTVTDHKRYCWIQIDEVQDLNPLQMSIIELLYDDSRECSCMLYLGDEQQAIFSFIGAKVSTLSVLQQQCGGQVHRLLQNYRSPKHLLDLYNDFAEYQLGVARSQLPQASFALSEDTTNYLCLCYSESNEDEVANVAKRVVPAMLKNEHETTAIIVPTNRDANKMSESLGGVPHFKISGQDIFMHPDMKTLLSHFNVLKNEMNKLAWAQLFRNLKVEPTYAKSRTVVSRLFAESILPTDFLCYESGTYLTHFCQAYEHETFVVYDTETTGTDVFEDDIVQLAAFKVRGGVKVEGSDFEVLLTTEREIPSMLGDLVNPLVEVYAQRPHVARQEGLAQFVAYAEGCVLCGHNVNFDNSILYYNLKRSQVAHDLPLLPSLGSKRYFTQVFDTLKLSKLLFQKQKSYKLKSLLEQFGLEGENSHLANDDILATWHLMELCYRESKKKQELHEQRMQSKEMKRIAKRLVDRYVVAFFHTLQNMYAAAPQDGCGLLSEMEYIVGELQLEIPKLDYIMEYLRIDVINTEVAPTLRTQLEHYLMDLNTYRETDLCESQAMRQRLERVFVTTVHKAKGLEFDNVIVLGVVDGVYPFFNSKTEEEKMEDARKLYVALSRAKKRLCLCYHGLNHMIDGRGYSRTFPRTISPFCDEIAKHCRLISF